LLFSATTYLGAIPEEGQHERDSRKILTRVGFKKKEPEIQALYKNSKEIRSAKWGLFIKVAEPLCFGLLGAVFITKKD
jgi:hypothetical protein